MTFGSFEFKIAHTGRTKTKFVYSNWCKRSRYDRSVCVWRVRLMPVHQFNGQNVGNSKILFPRGLRWMCVFVFTNPIWSFYLIDWSAILKLIKMYERVPFTPNQSRAWIFPHSQQWIFHLAEKLLLKCTLSLYFIFFFHMNFHWSTIKKTEKENQKRSFFSEKAENKR